MGSTSPAPSPALSLTPPLALHEKELLFADWGLSDTDGSQSLLSPDPAEKTDSRLAEREREHRRKSRAFAAAAKKAAEKIAEKARAEEAAKRKTSQEDEEGSDNDDDIVEVIDLTRPAPPPPPRPPRRTVSTIIESVRASATLRRTSSNPLPEGRDLKRKREEVPVSTTTKRKPGRPGRPEKTAKKDSRDITPPLVPEGQRIFDGLSFYYLPDAALGARRLRINKARQHGARWVRSLGEATHVVVDKQLRWADVEVFVKEEMSTTSTEMTPALPILVNEDYPLDCIGFRHLLNPEQRRYRITGWTEAQAAKEREKEKEREKKKDEKKIDNKSPSNHYTIKPDRRQQSRLETTGQQEHMVRQPRQGG